MSDIVTSVGLGDQPGNRSMANSLVRSVLRRV